MHQIDVVDAPAGTLLESLRWHSSARVISWVDIPSGQLHTLDPLRGQTDTIRTGVVPLGAALPRGDHGWTLCGGPGVYQCSKGTVGSQESAFPDQERVSNDAAFDPWGRLYVGRMSPAETEGEAALVAREPDGSWRTVADGLTLPNGLVWSRDGRWMYFAETHERRVYRMPTSPDGEEWSERQVLVQLTCGFPDGIALDPDGNLWIACYGTGEVVCVSPDGQRLAEVRLPVSQVTSCIVVGSDLYVTSAAEGFTDDDWHREPHAGRLFRVRDVLPGVHYEAPSL